jgi:hypothetical protein
MNAKISTAWVASTFAALVALSGMVPFLVFISADGANAVCFAIDGDIKALLSCQGLA